MGTVLIIFSTMSVFFKLYIWYGIFFFLEMQKMKKIYTFYPLKRRREFSSYSVSKQSVKSICYEKYISFKDPRYYVI